MSHRQHKNPVAGVLALVLLAGTLHAAVTTGSWDFVPSPQTPVGFRGDGSGTFPGATPVASWDPATGSNIIWKTPMPGTSHASPIVVGDRVFCCADPQSLVCVDARDGAILWSRDMGLPVPEKRKWHDSYGYTFPTPASDGSSIYAKFPTGALVRYTLDGRELWRVAMRPHYSEDGVSSPVYVDDVVVVADTGNVFGFDAATGAQLWNSRTLLRSNTSTLTRVQVANTTLLATHGGDILNPKDGTVLASGLGRGPGALDKKQYWDSLPAHGDIALFTFRKPFASLKEQQQGLTAYRITAKPDGRGITTEQLWQPAVMFPIWNSPVIHDGRVYWVGHNRHLYLIAMSDGSVQDLGRFFDGGEAGDTYSSTTVGGELLFQGSNKGRVYVIEGGAAPRIVHSVQMEPVFGSPSFQGDRMYWRTLEHLWCIGEASKPYRSPTGAAAGAVAAELPKNEKQAPAVVESRPARPGEPVIKAWDTRLAEALAAALVAKRRVTFNLKSMQHTFTVTGATGSTLTLSGEDMSISMRIDRFQDADKAALAAAVAEGGDDADHAVATFFSWLTGDTDAGDEHRRRAGEAGAAVDQAFGR